MNQYVKDVLICAFLYLGRNQRKRKHSNNQSHFTTTFINKYLKTICELKIQGLDDKYYIKDQTAYAKHITKLGRYALYNKRQTYKEASSNYGTYFEMKEIIEELTQETV